MKARRYCGTALIVLVVSAGHACATRGPDAKTPQGAAAPSAMPSAAGATAPNLAQYGIGDAPTSGEASTRPRMNAAAAVAYAEGMRAFQAGNLEGARTNFAKSGEADPKAFQAFYSLGVVRERLGDTGGAGAAYRKALVAVEDYEPAIVAYGVMIARLGKSDEAESFLKDCQGKMPRSAAVIAALAEVKSLKGDSGEAQRLAQEALKKNPDYRPAMETLARDHYRNRRLDLAMYALKGILDGYGDENPPRDKNNAQARLLRGLIYREQGFRREAIEEFRKALELRPDLVEARLNLAAYLLESGNAVEAAPLLEGALRYDRDNVLARLNLGDAYRLLGKSGEARRELEWVLSKDPAMAQAHYNLGLLFLFSGSIPGLTRKQSVERAIGQLEEYKKKKPRTGPDDTDELLSRAKSTKAQMEAEEQAGPVPSATPSPVVGPAASASSAPFSAAGAAGAFPAASSRPTGAASAGAQRPATAPSSPSGATGRLPPADEPGAKK